MRGARTRIKVVAVLILIVASAVVLARAGGWVGRAPDVTAATPVSQVIADDAGDQQATTTFDGATVRKRAAIAIHPGPGAHRDRITGELQNLAVESGIGPLEPATFAVFGKDMLEYLVPEMTFVAPEGVSLDDTEALMRDHQPADVAFYLVRPVLVHDLTFAVIPAGVAPAEVAAREDAEGILTDVLGKYRTKVQRSGVTVRYFGAILSDGSVASVRDAMGRAAGVPAERVQVSPNQPFPGVELSGGAHLTDDSTGSHHN